MAQVKKGLKGLFSRKKQKAADSQASQSPQATATTSAAPSKTTTAAGATPAAALGATSAAPKTEDLPPPPTPAQAPHAANDAAGETLPPPSHQKATFDPLPNEPSDPKFSKTTADPLKSDPKLSKTTADPLQGHNDGNSAEPTSTAGKSTTAPLPTNSRAAAVDPDTGKTTMGPLDRVTNAPNTAAQATTTAADTSVVEPAPGAIATAVPGQHPAMSATSGPLDAGEFAEGRG
ncbi:MAG: hypothetical protein OHK93_000873 [Ramalina farinacea]|uniref:Uncharacterized protein n=1 Tax=Ramalina farinacea TaxID=258253 RepID=A0AA43TX44_9LECA|nr:hypothetical protein [Ramalina farinacea]